MNDTIIPSDFRIERAPVGSFSGLRAEVEGNARQLEGVSDNVPFRVIPRLFHKI